MIKWILVFSGLFFLNALHAQDYNPNRYRQSIFTEILSIDNVKYGEAPQWIWPYWDVDLELNVYMPSGDDNPKRPLIIFAHSGGFINGNKDVDNMLAICDSFARKGYVTATIDYRKGFDPLDDESSERAVYRGVQDGKAAVRYFKENASLYDIDTNYIYFGGMSAGGFIALNVGYMDKESERPESTYGGGLVNDLECLDCAGNDFAHASSVRAVLDFWGAVDDTSLIEAGDVPLLIMHGEYDPVVPFVYGPPFGLFTLPSVYGGLPISERAESIGLDYEIFTSEGELHMLDGSDNGTFTEAPNSFWSDTLIPESTRFLWENMKPNTALVSADSVEVCAPFGQLEFAVTSALIEASAHYVWEFDAASISFVSGEFTNEVTLEFMEAGDFEITVTEYNEILCAGVPVTFYVRVENVEADFTFDFIEPNYVAFTNLTGDPSYDYTWYFGDGETSTEFEPNHVYETVGDYDVTLLSVSSIGCSDTSITTINIETLNIAANAAIELSIYPNPLQNQLTVASNEPLSSVIVQDAAGRIVYTISDLNEAIISVNSEFWTNGIYFISVENGSGDWTTQKVVKN